MVFSGIDGITGLVLSSEQGEGHGQIPLQHTTGNNKEISDLQDLYRRTLVASWRSSTREPDADKLIEDLFCGGSGWTKKHRPAETTESIAEGATISSSLSREPSAKNSLHAIPQFEGRPRGSSVSRQAQRLGKEMDFPGHSRKPGSMEQKLIDHQSEADSTGSGGSSHEVSEFDVRDNLRSWEITPRV